MKAILVLDEMPDVCGNCFLFDVNNDTDMREICVPKYWHTNKDEKPDWCPLKELSMNDGLIYKLEWMITDEKSSYKRTILQEVIDMLKGQEEDNGST